MIPLTTLWLPILLSAVLVFLASFLMHMVLTYHRTDYRPLPDEDRVTDAIRNAASLPAPPISSPTARLRRSNPSV